VVGGDDGLATNPVTINNLTMSIGERWEVVIDFAGMAGQNVTMFNEVSELSLASDGLF